MPGARAVDVAGVLVDEEPVHPGVDTRRVGVVVDGGLDEALRLHRFRQAVIRHLAGLRIEHPHERAPVDVEPHIALRVAGHVVNVDERVGQLVLGHNRAGRHAGRPRERLDLGVFGVEVPNSPQPVRDHLGVGVQVLPAGCIRQDPVGVVGHAVDDLDPVGRTELLHEGTIAAVTAVGARVGEQPLLLGGARHVGEPLRAAQLRQDVSGRRQEEAVGDPLHHDVGQLRRAVDPDQVLLVAAELHRPGHPQHVVAGLELRELELAAFVGVDGGADRRLVRDQLHHQPVDRQRRCRAGRSSRRRSGHRAHCCSR